MAMRTEDLDHEELLELDPEGGTIRFAGQRALLLDAVAMGLLRKYLVENFGLTAARTVLTQFGFAHGWRMAEAMQAEFNWNSDDDWQRAGTRIHALEALFRVEPGSKGPLSKEGVTLLASYEAEQHLLHFGRSDVPVCWTICGLTSGYVSRSSGKEIYVLEDHCTGEGDAACHLIGRTRQEWGDERAEELRFFEPTRLKECLDVSLDRVTETLKAAERKLRAHRRALVRVARGVDEPLGIVANSLAMRQVVDLARRVAKVEKLHTLAERLMEVHRQHDEIQALRRAGEMEKARARLDKSRAYTDEVLAFFYQLADLDQGLIERKEVPTFITANVKNWLEEEAKAMAAGKKE